MKGFVRWCHHLAEFLENEECVILSCRGNQNTHFVFHNFCYENRAVYEIMWKDTVGPDRPQMTV